MPSPASAFLRGTRDGLPFLFVVGPIAMLFGALATQAGLDPAQVMGFSLLVIAGAAQFTALQLLIEETPTVLVLTAALAVNLRTAMYSAALAPHLGAARLHQRIAVAYLLVDQSAVLSALEYERVPARPLPEKLAYFFGTMLPIAPVWYAATLAGALAGPELLPDFGLDYAIPITFLALVGPALRTRAHWAAAATATGMGLLLAGLPYALGLLPAAAAGMLVGAEIERRATPRP